MKLDNVRMAHALKHLQLVVDHLLVPANVLLQDDLDCDLALGAVCLPDDAIRASAQRLSKTVSRPVSSLFSMIFAAGARGGADFLS
jgi:hypothetical protein